MTPVERPTERAVPSTGNSSLRRRIRRGAIVAAVALVVVYTFFVMTSGGDHFTDNLRQLDPRLLVLPLIATFLSYLTMSLSYEGITRAAGISIRSLDMLRITFVANTANYVIPTGGLSGFALRMVMFTKRGVSAGRSVLISFTQTLLTNLMLMVFIVYGLLHLVFTHQLEVPSIAIVMVVIGILTVFLALCLIMVYRRSVRTRMIERGADLTERMLKRFGYYERYARRSQRFFLHINEGMEFFASEPRAMVGPLFWIFLDWVFTIGVLYAAFYSVGANVSYGQVVIAFSVAIVFAVISFVPGGVGVLEGSLALTFARLGVAPKECVLPILIFRVSFYVVPVLLSLLLARGAFAELDEAVAEELL